jgi:RNA polymerase sigma-70 factor (ECF subfamily)
VQAVFTTTHWSVVLQAGQTDSQNAPEALGRLCRTYWYPLYAYLRRKGHNADDAQDLTQEFFARLLARNYLSAADRSKGKFRSFLLGAVDHFLAKEWRRAHAQKRGGGQHVLSLDEMDAEKRYLLEPADELTPAKIFDRRWATTLLEEAMAALHHEYMARDQGQLFAKLQVVLSGDGSAVSYSELAGSLQMTEAAFKAAVYRIRKRYGELIRAQIAQTVATPEEIEEELRYLFAVLRE